MHCFLRKLNLLKKQSTAPQTPPTPTSPRPPPTRSRAWQRRCGPTRKRQRCPSWGTTSGRQAGKPALTQRSEPRPRWSMWTSRTGRWPGWAVPVTRLVTARTLSDVTGLSCYRSEVLSIYFGLNVYVYHTPNNNTLIILFNSTHFVEHETYTSITLIPNFNNQLNHSLARNFHTISEKIQPFMYLFKLFVLEEKIITFYSKPFELSWFSFQGKWCLRDMVARPAAGPGELQHSPVDSARLPDNHHPGYLWYSSLSSFTSKIKHSLNFYQ